jgi:hypothetical protein
VDTGGEMHPVTPRLSNDRSPGDFRSVLGRKNAERGRNAPVVRTRDDRVQVGGKLLARQVTVTIEHDYLTRVPSGISVSKPTSVGLPPSGLAARTMPLDSMPISFAGFRLKTITIVRPTSCSGS